MVCVATPPLVPPFFSFSPVIFYSVPRLLLNLPLHPPPVSRDRVFPQPFTFDVQSGVREVDVDTMLMLGAFFLKRWVG